jgi:transcription elongation factor Elf1
MLLKENSLRKEKVTTNKSSYYVYYFTCLECNKEIKAQTSQLKRHSGKCQRCSQLGEPYLFIYNELKNHRNKDVEFNISFDEFKKAILSSECHYCNTALVYNKHSREWGKGLTRAHQLDRKDNTKGYTLDNVVPCCWTCNRLKSDAFTYEEFCMLSPMLKEIQWKRKKIL